jgi:hypothetical protein
VLAAYTCWLVVVMLFFLQSTMSATGRCFS